MKKSAALMFVLTISFGLSCFAQDIKFLNKDETMQLVNGRVWNITRLADKIKVRWEFHKDGYVYGNNYSFGGSDSGTWTVNDAGQVCTTWRGRFVGGCRAIARESSAEGKRVFYNPTDLNTPLAEFTVE